MDSGVEAFSWNAPDTDMEKAEVLVESDENTQGVWTYLQRRLVLVKREKHCSL